MVCFDGAGLNNPVSSLTTELTYWRRLGGLPDDYGAGLRGGKWQELAEPPMSGRLAAILG